MNKMRLNLGCGKYPLPGFVNIDIKKTDGVDKVFDLSRGIPYKSNSIDEIYLGHFIEHLDFPTALFILRECFRVLKLGGVITAVSPDLEYFKNKAIEIFNYYIFPTPDVEITPHKSAWRSNALIRYMQIIGFDEVQEAEDSPYLTARVPWQFIVVGKKRAVPFRDYTVSIVAVTRDSREYIIKYLQSLIKASVFFGTKYEIILVDNNSSDDTVQIVKNKFPQVKIIVNTTNRGFAAANNQGAKASHGDFILFLNPDTEVPSGTVEAMANYLEKNPQVGAVGGLLLSQYGEFSQKEQRYFRKYPSILQTVLLDTKLLKFSLRNKFLKKHFLFESISSSHPTFVQQIPGACFMMRREQFHDLGGWDEEFPLYFEDVDLSYRIHKQGLKLCILPYARIFHIGGAEVSQINIVYNRLQFFSSEKIFFRKHYGFLKSQLFCSILTLLHFGYLLYHLMKYVITRHPMQKRIIREEKLFFQLWISEWFKDHNWIKDLSRAS
jgi:GT2 family glycosyltransferase